MLLLNEFILCSEEINHSGSQHMAVRRCDETPEGASWFYLRTACRCNIGKIKSKNNATESLCVQAN